MFLSYEGALKNAQNDLCITVFSQAVLEIFHFKVNIMRQSLRIAIFPNVSIKYGEQWNS